MKQKEIQWERWGVGLQRVGNNNRKKRWVESRGKNMSRWKTARMKVRAGKGEVKVPEKERERSTRKPLKSWTQNYVRCLCS